MDWFEQMDNYCERTDLTYWSEPVNAVTNAAFLIAAFLVFMIARRAGRLEPGIVVLMLILTAIGIGSYLFHTHATVWAVTADVVPILVYILVYIYLATHRMLDLPRWAGLAAVVLFIPYSAAVSDGIGAITGPLNGSVSYFPVPILIAAYAIYLRNRKPMTARGLMIGVAILSASLLFRTIDEAVCPNLSLGTHFLWHLLNGIMLGWMIFVMMRHDADNPRVTV